MISFDMLMCFSRIRHAPTIKENLGYALQEFTGKFRLIPICDTIEQVECWKDYPLAEPILALKKRGWFMAHWLLNVALDQLFPAEDPKSRYVLVFTDDDAFEPRHFQNMQEAIEKNNNPSVVVCSMRRWMHSPTPVDQLNADAAHMRCCCAGFEMIYVRSDIMQHYRFANSPVADGYLIEQLHKELASGFCFMPNLVVNWNRYC